MFFSVVKYKEDGVNSNVIFYDGQGTMIMADRSQNKTLVQKTSAVQWLKRSYKWPRGQQIDKEAIPPSPLATEEEENEEQPNKPKRKRSARSKSHGRKPQHILFPTWARELEHMPPIHEDDFKDIKGYLIEEP